MFLAVITQNFQKQRLHYFLVTMQNHRNWKPVNQINSEALI